MNNYNERGQYEKTVHDIKTLFGLDIGEEGISFYAGNSAIEAFRRAVAEGRSLKEVTDITVADYISATKEYEDGVNAHLHTKEEREAILQTQIERLRAGLSATAYMRVRETLMNPKDVPSDININEGKGE